jgi:hypothetical protein
MILNLTRFFAWQNLALLPLLSLAVVTGVRERGLPAVLLSGIALWLLFITLILPFQGHGWGYRYLHPYLGSFALLAGYGYQELRARIDRKADAFVLALSGVTLLATIPLLLASSYRFIVPFLAIERLIAVQRTSMVLIDTHHRPAESRTGSAIENILNLPDLTNRPLRISSRHIDPELLTELCRLGKITPISSADQHQVGFPMMGYRDSFSKLVGTVKENSPHCFVPVRPLFVPQKGGL